MDFARVLSRLAVLGVLRLEAITFVAIIVVALSLRLYGIDWDRGYSYTPHPDERAILSHASELTFPSFNEISEIFKWSAASILNSTVDLVEPRNLPKLLNANESSWNPRWFPYGSLPLYLLNTVQTTYEKFFGTSLDDLRSAARALSALADVGTVTFVYLLARKLYGRREAVLSSLLVSLAVLHIQLSHFFAVDTVLVFFLVGSVYFMCRVATEGRFRDSVLSGLFIGMGISTKISILPIFMPLLASHLLLCLSLVKSTKGNMWGINQILWIVVGRLLVATLASIIVLFVAQPYMLLDWTKFITDVSEQSEMVRRIRDLPYTRQYIETIPYWYHIRQLSTWGLGLPLGILAWAGLSWVSCRGMAVRPGVAYIMVGVLLPAVILVFSSTVYGILLATSISFLILMVTVPFRSNESRIEIIALSWVIPYLIVTGSFDVKFIRYMLPITPFLILFGSRLLIVIFDRLNMGVPRIAIVGLVLVIFGSSAFYAISYMSVYRNDHTGVQLSQWINQNAPADSIILMEHWEEGLPDIGRFNVRRLPLYEPDSSSKLLNLSKDLAEADYLIFYSNRLYATIPRLPERYPMSVEYYRLLFKGELGYQLIKVMPSYPSLAGVSFVENPFARTDLSVPIAIRSSEDSILPIRLGWADESFSVYDHPLGLIFKNVDRLQAQDIERTVLKKIPVEISEYDPPNNRPLGLLLSPSEILVQRNGGSWSDIVRSDSWTNDWPTLAWILLVEGIAFLMLPIAIILFRPISDRGYLFSKPLGILAVSLMVWLMASTHWVPFTRLSVLLALILLACWSAAVFVVRRNEIMKVFRDRWKIFLIGELIFVAAYLLFVVIRMGNPDLWHSHLGGEKPMDMAYLNAILKSSYMPPYDPWFSGGYLNYYYMGQFMVATLIMATGIDPSVAFNLAVPLFFALTIGGAFSVVYNLAAATKFPQTRFGLSSGVNYGRLSLVVAGICGALFVAVLGNLDGAIQVIQGAWGVVVHDAAFGSFDFWRSSRMMWPDPPGHEITEFPFFTFLFADLHAHLMAIPFTLLALGLAMNLVLGARYGTIRIHSWVSRTDIATLTALAIVIGALRVINTWDFPTYLLIGMCSILLSTYFRNGGISLSVLIESGIKIVLLIAIGYCVFLPYHIRYETFFASVETTTNQTVLWQFLAITGLFVFIIASFALSEINLIWQTKIRRSMKFVADLLSLKPEARRTGHLSVPERHRIETLRAVTFGCGVLLLCFMGFVIVAGWVGSTIPVVLLLVLAIFTIFSRYVISDGEYSPSLCFSLMMTVVAFVIVIGLDFVRVAGDIDRMNTVFKFYIQIWVLLALASAYLLWRMVEMHGLSLRQANWGKKVFLGGVLILMLGCSIYPVLGTKSRNNARFEDGERTLDGMAYMSNTIYRDEKGNIDLAIDLNGIRWIRENLTGSPVILEAATPSQYRYRWNGRISVYTGLPTIAGWQWHQEQQRWDYQWAVRERISDIDRIYNTTDVDQALSLLKKYAVEYIYIGQLERLYYSDIGLTKFDTETPGYFERLYSDGTVSIYRVVGKVHAEKTAVTSYNLNNW